MVGPIEAYEYSRYRAEKKAKPEGAVLSPEERASSRRREEVEKGMVDLFQKRADDPFGYTVSLGEQQGFEARQQQITQQERGRGQQALMAKMSGRGTLASGATNYNLMRFGQQSLQQGAQSYLANQSGYFQQRQSGVQGMYGMGSQILGAPVVGAQETDVANQRAEQHNEWKNRLSNRISNFGFF